MAVKVKVGDIVGSDYGIGKIIAITKEYLIHDTEDGGECCVFIEDRKNLFVPAEVDFLKEEKKR